MRASLVAQKVKTLSAVQETQAQSWGWQEPLEEGMTTHSSTLACRIPWTEEPGGLPSMGSHRVGHAWHDSAAAAAAQYSGWKRWVKEADLKLNIKKTKTMASSPIISWQTDGETMETVTEFIFLGSKITADGDCSHEIKRRLLLERKAMANLEHIQKQRHYFPNKGPSSQS